MAPTRRPHVNAQGSQRFSLDAASAIVVWVARAFWSLPYHHAEVSATYAADVVQYRARRRNSNLAFSARGSIGDALQLPAPESFEFFLCERYQFYAQTSAGLRRARVHHAPYALYSVHDASTDASLVTAAGLPSTGTRTPDLYSPGVDVEVFALSDVDER